MGTNASKTDEFTTDPLVTHHTQKVIMSDNKNPYQIRQELLNQAQSFVENAYQMQQSVIERQFQLAEMMMSTNESAGIALFKSTTDNLEKYCKGYPGVDAVVSTAREMQNFVDNNNKPKTDK